MTFGPDLTRTARKEHTCFLCGQVIQIGSRYISRAGKDENNFWFMQMHQECQQESNKWDLDDWESFSEGTMDRPVVSETLRIQFSEPTAEHVAEYLEITVWNTGRVEIKSNLKTGGPESRSAGGRLRDIGWDCAIDAMEATIMSFIHPGGMDIKDPRFKQAIEQTLNAIAQQHG